MTNYNERLDEIARDAYRGEIDWIHDQLDGTSFIGESLGVVEKNVVDTKQAITSLIKELVAEARIDPFDFVEPCEPDCDDVRHAYHQGQWDMATRIKAQQEEV